MTLRTCFLARIYLGNPTFQNPYDPFLACQGDHCFFAYSGFEFFGAFVPPDVYTSAMRKEYR